MNKKTKLAKLLDRLSLFVIIFLILFSIFTLIIENELIKIILSIFLCIVIFTSILKGINIRNKKLNLTSADKIKELECLNALKYGNPTKVKNFLFSAFSKKYKTTKHSQYIEIDLHGEPAIIYHNFSFSELPLSELIKAINYTPKKYKKILILGINFSQDSIILAQKTPKLYLLDIHTIYNFFKSINYYPKIKPQVKETHKTLLSLIKDSLNHNNTFRFIKYGLILFLLSNFIPYHNYYKFISLILFAFAIISIFRSNKQKTFSSTNIEI